ncbi:AAA family ATPase [Mucilaginibacter rigui]|uniref:AAA family ATPase n=1 Tax=Mucilaginibacter rigui TaxID=534635 RepID=A0ABR7X5F9_9SPHI|nr:AAA family ATPase [Mucilaginibacter rigui]MBD1385726.1 AAA family ATPase [Mucilaginibacter rigui]
MQKETLIEQARKLINDFTGIKKVSKADLAKKLNISDAVLTFIKQGQAEKLSVEMLNSIIAQLQPGSGFNLVGTSNYNSIQNICLKTQNSRQLNVVIGYTGAGKSVALNDYYRSKERVYYMVCKNSMNRRQFLCAILAEMGVNFMGNVYDMVNKIVDLLNEQPNTLLIIDEAGKVSTNVILDLHDIRNATMYSAGILLAGCEYFQTNIEKAVTKEKIGYPEFHSRVTNWNVLNRPTKAEVTAICQANGLTDEATIKELHRIPNYRLLYNAITNETDN